MNGFLFVSAYLNVCYLYGFQIHVGGLLEKAQRQGKQPKL